MLKKMLSIGLGLSLSTSMALADVEKKNLKIGLSH